MDKLQNFFHKAMYIGTVLMRSKLESHHLGHNVQPFSRLTRSLCLFAILSVRPFPKRVLPAGQPKPFSRPLYQSEFP
jgi:hypothetical protein